MKIKEIDKLRIHSVFGFTFLVMVAFGVMPIVIGSSLETRIYLDPSDYIFDSGVISTGYKFNITLRVDEVVDLVAWQVKMYYNDSIINITRWFEPTWDNDYVFYGKTTFAAPIQPDCAYDHVDPSNGSTQVGAILVPLPPNQTSFSGSGKLCIFEFIVTAIPSEDETLSCLLSINNPTTLLLETDGSVILNVTKEDGYYELHVYTYTLTITTTLGGTTDPSPGEYSYSAGTQVSVSAISDTDNFFDHWELDGENAGTINPIEVLMDSNHTLHAIFRSLTYNYNLTITTTTGGTTDPIPGNYTYVNGTVVSITATPDINHKFEYWILDGANIGSNNPIDILIDSHHNLQAFFTKIVYQLTVSTTTGGTTDPEPGNYTHTNGTVVSITAISDACYVFDHWKLDGVDVGSANPYSVLIDDNHTLHATFIQINYTLTITAFSGGTTDPAPGNYTYACGSSIQVTAIPDANYVFNHWELDDSNIGSDNPVEILMGANHTVLAVFAIRTYTLTITSTAGGTTDPTSGTYNYPIGSSTDVTAIPSSSYSFNYWLLDGEERMENPITVQMDINHTLHAVFTFLMYELTITITQGGTTVPSPGNYIYASGTIVSVTSVPDTAYEFAYWELDEINVGSDNLIEIFMDSNHSLHAVFNPVLYCLSIYAVERPSGTTNPPAGTHNYVAGTILNVTASSDPGFSFGYWSLDGEKRVENPITIVMEMNHTLIPYFVDDVPPEISALTQEPPENVMAYQNVTVTVKVTDLGTGVRNVTLWFSINNGTTWMPLTMTKINVNTYQATIPGYENRTWVRYRIVAYDNNGNQAINDDHRYYIQAFMHATKLSRSLVFLIGALIMIISGVFLLFVKAVNVHIT